MKIKWTSFTLIFNLLLIGSGLFAPGIEKETRHFLIVNGVVGIGLRAKTKDPLFEKKK